MFVCREKGWGGGGVRAGRGGREGGGKGEVYDASIFSAIFKSIERNN